MTTSPQPRPALKHKKRRRVLLVFVLLFIFSVPSLVAYLAIRPPVPYRKLERLKPGMSRDDVRAILGPPQSILTDKTWIFRRFANPGWVEVHFNPQDKLDHVNDASGGIKDLSPPVGR